jgi:hypothetical protein
MSVSFYVVVVVELLAVITGTWFLKQIKTRFLFLYLFVIVGFITEISKPILYYVFDVRHNWELTHYYFPIEFLLISLVYLKEMGSFYNKNLVKLLIAGFMLYCILNPLIFQDYSEYSQVRSFSSILLLVFSNLYFYKVMIEAKVRKLNNEPMIWINTAVLLYFGGSLFHNILFTIIFEYSREFSKLSAYYFNILNLWFYLLIAVGFWKAGKHKKAVTS